MEHIAALLLIVGCSGDLAECRELPAPVPVYEAIEDCEANLSATHRQLENEAARILSTCVFIDPAFEEEDAELVWDVTPDGKLHATVRSPEMLVASAPLRREKTMLTRIEFGMRNP